MFVTINNVYTDIKLRITFTDSLFEVKLYHDNYLCQTNLRKQLVNNNFTVSGVNYYDNKVEVV